MNRFLIIQIFSGCCFSYQATVQDDSKLPIHAYDSALAAISDNDGSVSPPRFMYIETIQDDKGNRLVRQFDTHALYNEAVVLENEGEDLSELQIDWSVPLQVNAQIFTHLAPVLCDEDDQSWVYCANAPVSVDVENEADAQDANQLIQENLLSKVWVDKNTFEFTRMTIFNTETIHPSPLARVDRFKIVLEFARAWSDGPLLTVHASRRLKGKYGFFISLDEYLEQTISNVQAL